MWHRATPVRVKYNEVGLLLRKVGGVAGAIGQGTAREGQHLGDCGLDVDLLQRRLESDQHLVMPPQL